MIPVNEFREENVEIIQLCQVLATLLANDKLVTNPIVCELFDRFRDKVAAHLLHEDRTAYGELLRDRGKEAGALASAFLENTHELKKLISKYNKKWCRGARPNEETAKSFQQQTTDIFQLVDQRLIMEENKLFPMLEKNN
jgi:iron-sulfur cluster repair protein YtfE (RIC family)